MGGFNGNLLNIGNKFEISEFYDALSSHFVASYILQPTRIVRNSKTLRDNIFLDSIELSSYSGNVTSKNIRSPPSIFDASGRSSKVSTAI